MTTKRILVPLDGDERSEAIVPLVAAVARDGGATVRLLRVYPVPERREGTHGRTVEYVDQAMSRLTAEGREPVRDPLQTSPVARRGRVEPPAVIADLEPELSRAVRQMDAGGARVRVLRHVLQRL